MPDDDLLAALGEVRIRFWICPVEGHSDSRTDESGRPVVTVEWRGDVAHCTYPGCGRTSETKTDPNPEEEPMTQVESLFDAADRSAPAPATREDATRHAWVKHYAAQALAAYATFRAEIRTLTPNPEPGARPDLGYLMMAATSSTAAAVALVGAIDGPGLIWDLTPEAGALNGEYEEWLADVLVRYGINPGHIDPDLNPADFAEAVA